MIIQVLVTLLSVGLSAFFYRCGGMSKNEKSCIPSFLRRSWIRDWILPTFSLIILFTWWKPTNNLYYLLFMPTYILNGLALSTYWGFVNKWLGKDKKDKYWLNWLLHGFFVGLSFFPFIWSGIKWYSVLINALVSGLLMMWISERSSKVFTEESGRGGISAISRLALLIK